MTKVFTNYSLPSLLASIQNSASTINLIVIYTEKSNLRNIEVAMKELKVTNFMEVRIEVIEPSFENRHKYDLMTHCHEAFIKSYVYKNDWVIFLHPDFLYMGSFNSGLYDILNLGDVILINTPRLSLEKLKEVYDSRVDSNVIRDFELQSKDIRRTIHPYFSDRFIGKGRYSSWPVELVFHDPTKDIWIIRAGGLHPLAVKANGIIGSDSKYRFDNDLLERLYKSKASFYVNEESNKLCIFEISPSNYQVGKSTRSRFSMFWIAAIYACWMPESFRRNNLKHDIWFGDKTTTKGFLWKVRKLKFIIFTRTIIFLMVCILCLPKMTIAKLRRRIVSKLGAEPFELSGGYLKL